MLQVGWRTHRCERCATCKFIKPRRPKSSYWTTAAVKASYSLTFHIFLSYQAEQTLILSSRWKEIATSGGAGGGEVMSSLPLGGISLIKMK